MRDTSGTDVTSIILTGRIGSVVVRELLNHMRRCNPESETLGRLTKHLGMPSRGYVADILSGRRKITRRYQDRTIDYLGLKRFDRDIVELMLDAERCRDSNKKRPLLASINNYKKFVRAAAKSAAASSSKAPTSLEGAILACFDIFSGHPTRRAIHQLFAENGEQLVDSAIAALIKKGLIVQTDSGLSATQANLLIEPTSSQDERVSFIKDSMEDASRHVERWFGKAHESCFQSFYVSAKSDDYLAAVRDIRRFIYERISALESKDSDCLAQVSVQVFPHGIYIDKCES